jgi:hypothetical protein
LRPFTLLAAGALALASTALAAPREGVRDPAEKMFSYVHPGRTVELTPSRIYAAALARDDTEKGTATAPPEGVVIDERSARREMAERGLTLYRIPFTRPPKGLKAPERRPPWLDVLEAGLSAQPVFEQGAVLKIPTDEIFVALAPGTSLEDAKIVLREASRKLGVRDLQPVRDGLFLLTLKDAAAGRALEASRTLAEEKAVVFAEPNFANVFLETPGGPPVVPGTSRRPSFPTTPIDLETVHGWKSISDASRAPDDKDWVLLLDGHFEALVDEWSVSRETGAERVLPMVTGFRAHTDRRSVYMTGYDLAAARPPDPYPDGAHTYLISPPFGLWGFEDAFVELWFWAQLEDPSLAPPAVHDFGRVLLVDAVSSELVMDFPIGPVAGSGDLSRHPTTENGWRRLLFRVPRRARLPALYLFIEFVSDGTGNTGGLFVDDIQVIATYDSDTPERSEDTLAHLQFELFPHGQIAGRPLPDDNAVEGAAGWKPGLPLVEPVVALLDDGVDAGHPDLRYWEPDEDATQEDLFPGEPEHAEERHGTACAGVLGAIADNARGSAGAAPGAVLLPLRRGLDDASIVRAIDESVLRGARVLVMPWGWTGAPSRAITEAILDAIASGTMVVAAAGNAGVHLPYSHAVDFPCTLGAATELVCVGAAAPDGQPKGASSVDGAYWWSSAMDRSGPDLLAPGVWLHTTDRRGRAGYNDGSGDVDPDWTDAFAGTGASACYVGGVASLMASRDPKMTPAEAKAILLETATELGARAGSRSALRLVHPEDAVTEAVVLEANRREDRGGEGGPEEVKALEPPNAGELDPQNDSMQ